MYAHRWLWGLAAAAAVILSIGSDCSAAVISLTVTGTLVGASSQANSFFGCAGSSCNGLPAAATFLMDDSLSYVTTEDIGASHIVSFSGPGAASFAVTVHGN